MIITIYSHHKRLILSLHGFITHPFLYCLVGKSLDDLITHYKTLLESMGSTEYVESNWTKRMTDMQEDWTKGRSSIFNWVVSDENHHSDKCSFCFGSDANVRCHQCGLSFNGLMIHAR